MGGFRALIENIIVSIINEYQDFQCYDEEIVNANIKILMSGRNNIHYKDIDKSILVLLCQSYCYPCSYTQGLDSSININDYLQSAAEYLDSYSYLNYDSHDISKLEPRDVNHVLCRVIPILDNLRNDYAHLYIDLLREIYINNPDSYPNWVDRI